MRCIGVVGWGGWMGWAIHDVWMDVHGERGKYGLADLGGWRRVILISRFGSMQLAWHGMIQHSDGVSDLLHELEP
jgi:hypothetical protein